MALILVVDDDDAMRDALAEGIVDLGYVPSLAESGATALRILSESHIDAALIDLRMSGMDGLELLARIREMKSPPPTAVLTAHATAHNTIEAMRLGAFDHLTKPIGRDALSGVLSAMLAAGAEKRSLSTQRSETGLIGSSDAMRAVQKAIGRLADSETTVLITGETGTGKELVARALHDHGKRAQQPFVAVNCAAIPTELMETELFGHVKGAFTDARQGRGGLFVEANGGTLFLDEIGELPLGLQPKLLRALQERKVRPVGGTSELGFDARLVTATNKDLESAVEDGRFRGDLFYRIDVVHVPVPPLRSRGTDVLLLAQHFAQSFSANFGKAVTGLSPAVGEKLIAYPWPGNVRELANAIERAVALTRSDLLMVEDLPEKIRTSEKTPTAVSNFDPMELVPLEEIERRYILRVLSLVGGNKSRAAQVLGFDRRTLYRKLERYQNGAGGGTSMEASSPARL